MHEDREYTIIADTEGGCDRTEVINYVHPLKMENAIFENDTLVGFYYEFGFYNGCSRKPNAHVFMLDNPATFRHDNNKSVWHLEAK